MLEFKKEYFQTETNRHLYPTTLDISKCEVYGCKEREAFMYKIPNNYYTSNAGNIDFSLYPNGVWSDYTAIKIVEKLPYFQPSVNFNKLGDITPSNLNKLKDEIKKHIVDIETAVTESVNFIDSGVPGQNNIPYLPNDCVWFRNGATGNIEALPIGELYGRFQNMIDSLYKEIKDLLLVDKKNMSQELRNETDELLSELNTLKNKLATALETLTEECKKAITKHKDDVVIPSIDDYVIDTSKPSIDRHVDDKKIELNKFIEDNKSKLKGDKGDTGERGEQGPVGPKGDSIKGDKGDKGDPGNNGLVIPIAGQYCLEVDSNGDLYVVYPDGTEQPKFTLEANGDLYLEID